MMTTMIALRMVIFTNDEDENEENNGRFENKEKTSRSIVVMMGTTILKMIQAI